MLAVTLASSTAPLIQQVLNNLFVERAEEES